MGSPQWSPKKLYIHYKKHPGGANKTCWCELLGKSVGEVSLDEYETRSKKVIENFWINFTAGYKEKNQDIYNKTSYFVDEDLCITAVAAVSQIIKTCYHDHPKYPPHILSSFTGKTEFIKKWTRKRFNEKPTINNPKVKSLRIANHYRRSFTTYVQEFEGPMRTRER